MDKDHLVHHLSCDYILVILTVVYAYAHTITTICSNREKTASSDIALRKKLTEKRRKQIVMFAPQLRTKGKRERKVVRYVISVNKSRRY